MKVLADYWFSDMYGDTVGIVVAEDEVTKERKAYIGVGAGFNQEADKESILDGGQKLPISFLRSLLQDLAPEKKE